MMKGGNPMHKITFILLVIGGLNWLLLGVFNWDIGMVFGGQSAVISRVIYILVGLSALYEIFTHKANCRNCNPDGSKPSGSAPSVSTGGSGSGM